ncbi:MAG: MinD/ParA family protein [Wujia sp.]
MDQASKLRAMVQSDMNKMGARVIAITSGKGGVGKTSTSVNIAIEMAKSGKKVVIFDADFGLANVEVMLGIRPRFNLLDVIYNKKNIEEIIMNGPGEIDFISGGSGVSELATLDNNSIKLLISELVKLDNIYDIVLIDTGAGITDSVMEFVMVSPEVLLVVTPEPTSITDAYSLLKVLRRRDDFNPLYKTIGVITNRVESDKEGLEIFGKLNTVSSKYLNTKLKYIGAVKQDKNASMSIIEQKPIVMAYPNSVAARDMSNLAKKLLHQEASDDFHNKEGITRVFLDFFRKKVKQIK